VVGWRGTRTWWRLLTEVGHRTLEAANQVTEREVSAALLPTIATDAALCTDGHAIYEAVARTTRITHFALNGGKRPRRTPKAHHINTVNASIRRYRDFIRRILRSSVAEPQGLRSVARRP